jgi:uncharacterized membrane protein
MLGDGEGWNFDVFGLPAHPLIVHAPAVFIPLTALLALLMVANRKLSYRFGPLILVIAGLAAASAFAAAQTGQALQDDLGYEVVTHQSFGERVWWFSGATFLTLLGLWLIDRSSRRSRRFDGNLLAIAVVVFAGLATFWVIRAGHTGAELIWGGRLP